MQDIPERDWKILRELKDVLLDRFCRRTLQEAVPILTDPSLFNSHHERYLHLFRHMHKRDKELAAAFNDLRRSEAVIQLAHMRRLDLLLESEFNRFSQETREIVESFLKSM